MRACRNVKTKTLEYPSLFTNSAKNQVKKFDKKKQKDIDDIVDNLTKSTQRRGKKTNTNRSKKKNTKYKTKSNVSDFTMIQDTQQVVTDGYVLNYNYETNTLNITFKEENVATLDGYILSEGLHLNGSNIQQTLNRAKYFFKARYNWNIVVNNDICDDCLNHGVNIDLGDLEFGLHKFILYLLDLISIHQMTRQFGSDYFHWISNTFLQIHFYNYFMLDQHIDDISIFWRTSTIRIGYCGKLIFGKRSIGGGVPGHCGVLMIPQKKGLILTMRRGLLHQLKHGMNKQRTISGIAREWHPFIVIKGTAQCLLQACYSNSVKSKSYWDLLSYLVAPWQKNKYYKLRNQRLLRKSQLLKQSNSQLLLSKKIKYENCNVEKKQFRLILRALLNAFDDFLQQFNKFYDKYQAENLEKYVKFTKISEKKENMNNLEEEDWHMAQEQKYSWIWQNLAPVFVHKIDDMKQRTANFNGSEDAAKRFMKKIGWSVSD